MIILLLNVQERIFLNFNFEFKIMRRILLFPTFLLAVISNSYLHSQTPNHVFDKSDSVIIREFYNMALSEGEAYENLRYLCKEIGARITGSTEAQIAVEWGQKIMSEYGF